MPPQPGFCEIITLVHISQQRGFGFLKNYSEHMLVTSGNFKPSLVFSACVQENILFVESIPISSIIFPSHMLGKRPPDKLSYHLLIILSVLVPPNLCSILILASSIFPLTVSTYPNSVSFNFRWTDILLKCASVFPASKTILFEFLKHIFPTTSYFICSHRRFDYQSWPHAHSLA